MLTPKSAKQLQCCVLPLNPLKGTLSVDAIVVLVVLTPKSAKQLRCCVLPLNPLKGTLSVDAIVVLN